MSTIKINKREDDAEEKVARICAEFVRQGVIFCVTADSTDYIIVLTGGF